MLLPWDYGVRNLARRPARTTLTLIALAIVILLIFVVVGFIRGLEKSLQTSGESDVVLVYSVNSSTNIENSAIDGRTGDLLAASLPAIRKQSGVAFVSPELYFGTRVTTGTGVEGLGLVRGVTPSTPLVRQRARLHSGHWPNANEVLVGRLAATKLGVAPHELELGKELLIEGKRWTIGGTFTARGSSLESELWCPLPTLQTATKRQDLSLIALRLDAPSDLPEVALFCQQRLDLEIQAIPETEYYSGLQQHYRPVRTLAWAVVWLVTAAGVFAGLNMMYGAVAGRVREIATLQAIGYRRRAIVLSLVQEGTLLAAAAALLAGFLAIFLFDGYAVRFTMGAFELQIDGAAILIGCTVGLLLGTFGAMPPAIKVLKQSVAQSLKSH